MIEQGSQFFFAPADQIEAAIVAIATDEGARPPAQAEVVMGMYGFHLPPLRDVFLANHKAGLAQQILLDLSQEMGKAEHPDVVALITAGVDVVIGTSPLHQILHSKYLIAKALQQVGTGSYNFSLSAAKQDNTFQIFTGADVWNLYRQHFAAARQWCLTNEPQHQIKAQLLAAKPLSAMALTAPARFQEA